jgi:hypothetical protein
MIRILKKVDNRYVWFDSPITIATHWSEKEFVIVEKVIAKNFEPPKQKDHINPCIRKAEQTLNLKYDAEQGRYIVQKQVIHEPTTLYYNSFVLDSDKNVYAELVDDYGNEVFLKIN